MPTSSDHLSKILYCVRPGLLKRRGPAMPVSVSQCGPLALAGMAARRPDERVAISGITTAHQRSRIRLRLSMYRHQLGRPGAAVWPRVRSGTVRVCELRLCCTSATGVICR